MNSIRESLRSIWNSSYVIRIRGLFFSVIEVYSRYYFEKKKFKKVMGYDLDLKNPQSFSHHIIYKKIHDRQKVLSIVADKYEVREYLTKVLGDEKAREVLIPLLYHTYDPETIPFDTLTGEYIIKANHNSGPNFIIEEGIIPDRQEIILNLKKQLSVPYGVLKHEWAYKNIKPQVVVEMLLRDKDGTIPKDYKFHMIGGECAFIQVDFDRFIDHSRTLYDKNWKYIPVTLKFKQGKQMEKPENLDEMLKLAGQLSKGFDYVRVDLYSIGNKVYFGELTHYPGSGMERFTPQSFDFELDSYWKIHE